MSRLRGDALSNPALPALDRAEVVRVLVRRFEEVDGTVHALTRYLGGASPHLHGARREIESLVDALGLRAEFDAAVAKERAL